MRLAYDMSAFIWRAFMAGIDKEFGREIEHEGKTVKVNGAQYGFDGTMSMMLSTMKQVGVQPMNCILVFEGMSSRGRRQAIDPTYKAVRDTRPPEAYEEFQKCIALLERAWLDMGAIAMRQSHVEGDDVLAYLAEHTESALTVATYDNDLTPLNKVNAHGATVQVWIDGVIGGNARGSFPHGLVTLYKALTGKSGEIPGCVGFGKGAFNDLRAEVDDDGLQEIQDMFEAGDIGELFAIADETKSKPLQMICNQAEHCLKQYRLAKLHPEWVNTLMHTLEVKAGKIRPVQTADDLELRPYLGQSWLVSRENWDQTVPWALSQFLVSPFVALDIETSTPEESDAWLEALEDPDGVDVIGSYPVSVGLTFGPNMQYTIYATCGHKEEPGVTNVTSEDLRCLVAAIPRDKHIVIQNLNFELPVLHQAWGDKQFDNGCYGFLPNCLDTKLEASYVNENVKLGLKDRSALHLGYKQQTFKETTRLSGCVGTLPAGGRLIREWEEELEQEGSQAGGTVPMVERQYKMHELTARQVYGYGADDPICTAALHNYYKLIMELEHTWKVYLKVEIGAAYLTAAGYLQGVDLSVERINELKKEDDEIHARSWALFRDYLISQNWPGSTCPEYTWKSEAAEVKEAFEIVTGRKLDTKMRKMEKLIVHIREVEDQPTFAEMLEAAFTSKDWAKFNAYVKSFYSGEPDFNPDSPKQNQKFLYEMLKLPIRVRNKPTDQMRAAGIKEGSPKADVLAIDWALKYDVQNVQTKELLQAFKLMKMVETRRKLYYKPYPLFKHWTDGKVHSSTNQCETNTRRASESGPNKQQLPKHPKIEGQPPKMREAVVPHARDAVIVSLDFKAQELVNIAEWSQDPNMIACFVGDNKKDIHSLTGVGIARRKYPQEGEWSYETFIAAYEASDPRAKDCRNIGKKVNFTTEYGAMAKKVAETLLIPEDEAQAFIDAKEAAFARAAEWKLEVIEEVKNKGIVRTMMGGVRHLREALQSADAYERSKAERQAVNFKVQGSCAEQTKLAESAMWDAGLIFKYDCVFIGPIHDEVVWSCTVGDLFNFLPELHACMIRPYGGMKLPIVSSISFGPNFGQQIEIGEEPTREAIEGGLRELRKMLEPERLAA